MTAVLDCRDVGKSFGRVQALAGASIRVARGTIHGLVGENGAGKTTLMKIVTGELGADSGQVDVAARPGLVRQQLSTVPELSVLDNIIFGAEPVRAGLIDRRAAAAQIGDLMAKVQLPLPLYAEAISLPLALQQRMEILRVLYHRAELILMDEPTALLTPKEADALFDLLRGIVATGHTVVLITHKLREVEALCDAVTVIRRGRTTRRWENRPFSVAAIAAAMMGAGGEADSPAPAAPAPPARATVGPEPGEASSAPGGVMLSVQVGDAAVTASAGEVTGIAGVAGNGQDSLVEHVCGLAAHPGFGRVTVAGAEMDGRSTKARRRAGLRLIPGDVRTWGSAVDASILDNVVTAEADDRFIGRFGLLRKRAMTRYARDVVAAGDVVCAGLEQPAGELSGGNLQRLVVARELGSGGRVVVANEPTRGVDFRAAAAIRRRLREFATGEGAVLLVSSDLDELFEISDRILVMYRGAIVGEVPRAEFDPARLGELMGGVHMRETVW